MAIVPARLPIVRQNIERCGQHIFAVFPDEVQPAFIYTIGNASLGLPELLVIGNFTPHRIAPILNEVGAAMRKTGQPPEGDIDLGGAFPVRARRASALAADRYTVQASEYLGSPDYDVVQLLIPDPCGRYPGEPDCERDYDVPLA